MMYREGRVVWAGLALTEGGREPKHGGILTRASDFLIEQVSACGGSAIEDSLI